MQAYTTLKNFAIPRGGKTYLCRNSHGGGKSRKGESGKGEKKGNQLSPARGTPSEKTREHGNTIARLTKLGGVRKRKDGPANAIL